MFNIYRLSRLLNIEINVIISFSIIFTILIGVACTSIIIIFQKKINNLIYLSILLWYFYYLIGLEFFNYIFPITYQGDVPPPIVGLFLILGYIIYPIYIFIVIVLSANWRNDKTNLKNV